MHIAIHEAVGDLEVVGRAFTLQLRFGQKAIE